MNDKHGSNPKINMFKKECRREQDEDNLEKKKRIIDINIVCDIIPREWDKSNPANIALKLKHKEYTTL